MAASLRSKYSPPDLKHYNFQTKKSTRQFSGQCGSFWPMPRIHPVSPAGQSTMLNIVSLFELSPIGLDAVNVRSGSKMILDSIVNCSVCIIKLTPDKCQQGT
jgi:hypothetical protein